MKTQLKYLGFILAFIGLILTSGGLYEGSSVKFDTTISEAMPTILTGIVLLVVGSLMWLFIEESGKKMTETEKNWLSDKEDKE